MVTARPSRRAPPRVSDLTRPPSTSPDFIRPHPISDDLPQVLCRFSGLVAFPFDRLKCTIELVRGLLATQIYFDCGPRDSRPFGPSRTALVRGDLLPAARPLLPACCRALPALPSARCSLRDRSIPRRSQGGWRMGAELQGLAFYTPSEGGSHSLAWNEVCGTRANGGGCRPVHRVALIARRAVSLVLSAPFRAFSGDGREGGGRGVPRVLDPECHRLERRLLLRRSWLRRSLHGAQVYSPCHRPLPPHHSPLRSPHHGPFYSRPSTAPTTPPTVASSTAPPTATSNVAAFHSRANARRGRA